MRKFRLFVIFFSLVAFSCSVKNNPRLAELAESDQTDRKTDNPEISKNDMSRLQEVKALYKNNVLRTSDDFYNAAIVFQHGEEPNDYLTANQLAEQAVNINPENQNAKILVAQSMDRYLLSTNKPQIFGTQRIELGELEYLQQIDTSQISDNRRKELGLMTLEELLNYFNTKHNKNESNILAFVPSDSLLKTFFPEKRADLIGTFDELVSKINYPTEALKNNISGKVLVEYKITPNGDTKDIIVLDGIGYGCDEEAKRIISIAKYRNYLNQDIERRTRIPFEIETNANKK